MKPGVKVAIVVSTPMTILAFLQDQIRHLSQEYDVAVIANLPSSAPMVLPGSNITLYNVDIERKISLWKDLKAFLVLWRLFRKERFRVVHSITPKAGLLAMSAAFFSGVPNRLHTYTGQVWATRHGLARRFLRWMDCLIFTFSTWCYIDSHSQRDFLLRERVVNESASSVLMHGSISGVDVGRFAPSVEARAEVRNKLGIPDTALVFLFLGRMNPDKGVVDLVRAFKRLATEVDEVILLVVGPDEAGVRAQMTALAGSAEGRLLFIDYTDKPEDYMNAADVFCLPSYREGFGSVIIEAAAVGIPSIGSRIYGITDAVIDGETGLLHEAGNIDDIYIKMRRLVQDRDMCRAMGKAAQQRVRMDFTMDLLSSALMDEYRKITGLAPPE